MLGDVLSVLKSSPFLEVGGTALGIEDLELAVNAVDLKLLGLGLLGIPQVKLGVDFFDFQILKGHTLAMLKIDLGEFHSDDVLVLVKFLLVCVQDDVDFLLFGSLNDFHLRLNIHAVHLGGPLHVLAEVCLKILEQSSGTDCDISDFDSLEPDTPAFYDLEHLLSDLLAQRGTVSKHGLNS